jgi:hypothetical protein
MLDYKESPSTRLSSSEKNIIKGNFSHMQDSSPFATHNDHIVQKESSSKS